jgi:hypothetical protein
MKIVMSEIESYVQSCFVGKRLLYEIKTVGIFGHR